VLITIVNNFVFNLLNPPDIHQNQMLLEKGGCGYLYPQVSAVGKTLWITPYKVVNHWAIWPVDKLVNYGDKSNG
jgi:hypothetical protein